MSDDKPLSEIHVSEDQADLWAMWHGFDDATDLKTWGVEAEKQRLAELGNQNSE